MENNKWLAEPIRASVSWRLLGSCKKDHTIGWELLSVMSAPPRGSVGHWLHREMQGTHTAHPWGQCYWQWAAFTLKWWMVYFSCSHKSSVPESAGQSGKEPGFWSLIEPGFKSWFHLWGREQVTDSFGASLSLSIKWDPIYLMIGVSSGLVVKDLLLSLLWFVFNPWTENFCRCCEYNQKIKALSFTD